MRNVIAIADKEVRGYFASPIGYILIGLFALLFGYFFYVFLMIFNQQSQQMMQFGAGGGANINQMMIRGLFQNAAVIILFVMPMITMRTYSEEKRSGTIELLLTSPVTDLEIILGKFFGALALYAAMLLVTVLYMVMLFKISNPEWRPIAAGYLGLLLMGSCFLSTGLFISSLTKNQIVAGFLTFTAFLMLWVVNWIGESASPNVQALVSYLSITEHLDDFVRGIIDTKHVVYYLSFITFGLFLTARSVDSERWRG
ncbi:MAG: ABC transporter permease subunit [Acidobacteriota bacterium]